MARKTQIEKKKLSGPSNCRTAKSVADFRKALSVILATELDLDADRTANIFGTSRRTVFRHRNGILAIKTTPRPDHGVAVAAAA